MPLTPSLIQQLKATYPQFHFKRSDDYLWSPHDRTIYYKTDINEGLLLHELSHGLLEHNDYLHDIELITMERDAWDNAVKLALTYRITINQELIDTTLDSYRDWLHARSTCPECQATGLQIKKRSYACVACRHTWQVNEARMCALRRTKA